MLLQRRLATLSLGICVLISFLGACGLKPPVIPPAAEERVASSVPDAVFLYHVETVLLANGFNILERAIDSSSYRYEVSWVVPSVKRKFWVRASDVRYNGQVVAACDTAGTWLIRGLFGDLTPAGRDSVSQAFKQYVLAPLQQRLAGGM